VFFLLIVHYYRELLRFEVLWAVTLSIVFISLCLKHVRSVAAGWLCVHLLLYLSCDLIDLCPGVVLELPVKNLEVF
jgi:hypothetical protein